MGTNGLAIEYLRTLLDYNPFTGRFVWKVRLSRSAKVGDTAGYQNTAGYIIIGIEGQNYLAHRLAWMHYFGCDPPKIIDHIDGIKCNNKIANLRAATNSQNIFNMKANIKGRRGVYWHKRDNKWYSSIRHKGKLIYFGSFSTEAEATDARSETAIRLFGEFANDKRQCKTATPELARCVD